MCLLGLDLQRFNLPPQLFILRHLALQKAPGQRGFFSNAGGGEQVGVTQLVGVFAEVAHLDPAFFGQRAYTVVDATQAHADLFGQSALADARALLQQLQRPEVSFFVDGAASGGHGRGMWEVF